ncbi:hemolysin family protein [Paenibacillus sp. SC116]|uniref:hemolysin family protein n=1 Tax=Paenibacillus sp. SC116 TaxID=2968986 RepID=UPI00215AF831|nr:hemolysin family protein [Paenibacillus sp. SC116]MCR8845979.1 hemolysin family protein [Paenibacillus sp. SC116]
MLLVLLNGFFVAAEFAMVKVRGSRIDALAQEGNARAKLARHLTDNLNAYLSACQLGITIASLGLGWIGEHTVARLLYEPLSSIGATPFVIHAIATAIAFMLITIVHIVLGEVAPKSLAVRNAEKVTLWAAMPLTVFYKLMYPFIWMLNGISSRLLRLVGVELASEHNSAHTEEEIRILVKESHKSGLIDNTELALMDNIFEFSETHAREIMIPRTDMVCLYTGDSFEQNKDTAFQEMHTRYPVCDPDKDNIIGFVHLKDLVKVSDDVDDIHQVIRPILSVPESMSISALMKMMQKNRMQIAVLIDEYGGTAGLVTLEDIMEEIVGEIQDEFDEELPQIVKRDEHVFSVDGMMLIEAVKAYFNVDIASDDFDTIGGWAYAQVDAPKKGQVILSNGGWEFIIEETYHLRITRLLIRRVIAPEQSLESVSTA